MSQRQVSAMHYLYSALEKSVYASPRTQEMVYAAIAKFISLQRQS